MYSNFPDIGAALKAMFILICILVPFALWKAIEVVVWLFQHVSISWG